eukprot:m.135250 g.135250  ORF g.135250 m.135250 type:complete len:88 (+) comp9881_c0_seq1:508-771(+)
MKKNEEKKCLLNEECPHMAKTHNLVLITISKSVVVSMEKTVLTITPWELGGALAKMRVWNKLRAFLVSRKEECLVCNNQASWDGNED